MKIVFLAPFGIRPKGTVIARMLPLAAALQQIGHKVVIIAPPYTNPEDSGTEETVNGVTLKNAKLPCVGKALAAMPLGWQLFRMALAEKPDLIHLFKPKGYAGISAMFNQALSCGGFRLPQLFVDTDDWEGRGGMNELHGYSFMEKRFYAFQEQWLLRSACGVTVASRGLEQQAGEIGVLSEQLLYLPNCVTEKPLGNRSSGRGRFGFREQDKVVLLYTRFFEFGQERLHRILADIAAGSASARFLVIGQGRHGEESQLLIAAEAGGFADRLIMAGWIEPSELSDCLSAGDVALYPFDDTLVNRCKCPAKLTEILMEGVAVVGDRVGQIAEYIDEGESGLLCNPLLPAEMSAKTLELLDNHDRRCRIGENGRSRLLDHFSWRRYADMLDNFYVLRLGAVNK